MNLLVHSVKMVIRILGGSYNYSKVRLLFDYMRILLKSIARHKLRSSPAMNHEIENFLGYSLKFNNYPELLTLIEEIFIVQVYQSESLEPGLVLDCGSHIGISILYFRNKFPDTTIIGFEPDQKLFKLLSGNISHNNLKNVTIYNSALGDSEGEIEMYQSPAFGNLLSIAKSDAAPIRVPVKKLSSFIQQNAFVKIDVEGSEKMIVDDLIQSRTTKEVTHMIIEFHPRVAGTTAEALISSLRTEGFNVTSKTDSSRPGVTDVLVYAHRN